MGPRRAWIVAAWAVLCAGCMPLTPPPPFHFLETAAALPKGQVSVTFSGGAGTTSLDGPAAGGGIRVRVGLGGGHELGFEGTALYADTGDSDPNAPGWIGKSAAWGYKLSWKYAPRPWVALITGFGGSAAVTGDGVGVDFGVLFSRSRGIVRPYGATRITVGIPVDRPNDQAGGVTPGLAQVAGLALVPLDDLRIYLEAGALLGWSEQVDATGAPVQWGDGHYGGYGAAGIELRFGRSASPP